MNAINQMLSCLVENARIDVDPNGWTIRAVDEALVGMLLLRIKRSAFSEYEARDEEITLDIKRLKKMLAHLKGSDNLSIEGTGSRLKFVGGPLAWTMELPDVDLPEVKDQRLEYPASCRVQIEDLRTGTKAATDVSESVALRTDADKFVLTARGETDEVEMALAIEDTESAECIYPLDYFHNCVSALPVGWLGLTFGNDLPVVLSMVAWDGSLDAKYLIAPMIAGGD